MTENKNKDSHNFPDSSLDLCIDRVLSSISQKWDYSHKKIKKTIRPLIDPILAREAILSNKVATFVDDFDTRLDKRHKKTLRYLKLKLLFARRKRLQTSCWCLKNRRKIIGTLSALSIVAASSALVIENVTAYEYMYNGKSLGIVENRDDVFSTIEIIGDKLSSAYGVEISIDTDNDIQFRKTFKIGKELDNKDDILNRFTYMRDMNAIGYSINIDGQPKTILYSKECAEKILKEIQDKYIAEESNVTYIDVCFAENVNITEVNTKIGDIQNEDNALEYLLTGAVEKKIYTVKSGDTFSQIAKDVGLSQEDLMIANPSVHPEKLQIDQELILNKIRPLVTVQTTEIAEYTAPIEYDVIYEETSTLYKGEKTVKVAGSKGERQVVSRVVRQNGEEVNRSEISSKIISEPTNQIVLKGTKEPPKLVGTGRFIYPTRGTLTSRFGTRWGRMHNGIDLAAPIGTKIKAADGGLVISAGWEGALGYCVRIDHGQNKTSVYGHCSKLFVKKGDRVYQNQHIANIGNTGRSTGPHLHFEIHVKGVPQNPLKHLK